jgi:predicted nucleotidyltransferase
MSHSYVPIDRNVQLDSILFEDHLVLLASIADDSQSFIHNFHTVTSKYNMEISTEKSKTMIFCGKKTCSEKDMLKQYNDRMDKGFYTS